jgi:hypothetical protein
MIAPFWGDRHARRADLASTSRRACTSSPAPAVQRVSAAVQHEQPVAATADVGRRPDEARAPVVEPHGQPAVMLDVVRLPGAAQAPSTEPRAQPAAWCEPPRPAASASTVQAVLPAPA